MTSSLLGRLEGLAAFVPRFEAANCSFGEWSGDGEVIDGVVTMPYYSYSALADAFVTCANDLNWVREDCDWPTWSRTPEAAQLRDDPAALAQATPDQLACLLTTVIRKDRYCEGELAAAFDTGLLTGICRRAAQLAAGDVANGGAAAAHSTSQGGATDPASATEASPRPPATIITTPTPGTPK